jgi:purine-binding chemotaxis protein CheW
MNQIARSPMPPSAHTQTGVLAAGRAAAAEGESVLVTLSLGGQLCGVPVLCVRDVLAEQPITRIPLAPPEIAGSLNLRGRIVTAIDLRRRLSLPPLPPDTRAMSVVVEQHADLYSLMVDAVGDVMSLPVKALLPNPPTLNASWRAHCSGVYRLEQGLLAVLDVERLLTLRE